MRARLALLALPLALLTACGSGIPPAQNYATIQGRAYDVATNGPVPGVTITALTILNATTGADGTYRIANVPLGPCTIDSVAPPSNYALQGPLPSCGTLTAGQTLTIDIPLVKH